ncbi:tRNA pseudouridine(38-40) synthase TruA [Mariniphaga sediminis]|uniref:tRNA pseudouridine synthase A n=1 Tax=Mariniphaga sediminis TaxID=1628158 RepID=A0A399CZE8_9BACT|nr:tRNA pseudouridine(38-40) synthase TruA [Mariniphaga sediminis]RIH64799.1 tRNA pseudouridine(38-40) synthase TruA [Mariniphaga sediminis]
MYRYFVQLSFKGTRYHGWQVQPNAISVQEVLEKAFSTILREEISVVGAGRTDTGVHASFFVLHFDTENEILDTTKLVFRLNSFLPFDIAIQKIWQVTTEAHARFGALSRTYHYYITTQKNPFQSETAFYYRGNLDVAKMNEAARILLEYDDFTSFSRLHTDVKTNLCKIYRAEWQQEKNRLVFTIRANRFLRNMVRAVVGTLLEVGKGKLSLENFREIIEVKDRGAAGASAPAHGLFLAEVEYPDEF